MDFDGSGDVDKDDVEIEPEIEITVLAKGDTFVYTVPSFPVYKPTLQQVKLQLEESSGEVKVFDGFAKQCDLLDKPLPAVAKIVFSYDNAFLIKKEEFERSVNIENCDLYDRDQAFVMWNWLWLDESMSDEESSNEEGSDSFSDDAEESEDHDEDTDAHDEDIDAIPSITHSVVFKCIGTLKQHEYQETLALVKRKMREGTVVPVKLEKEPLNPVDTKAIAFVTNVNGTWERIGYVVQEILDEMHKAMDDNLILNVQFDCVKYTLYFKYPGWYAGIKITRNGDWSRTVIRCRSTLT